MSKVEHKHPIRAIAEQSPEAIGAVGELLGEDDYYLSAEPLA